jgi:site-specific recombinase XerD
LLSDFWCNMGQRGAKIWLRMVALYRRHRSNCKGGHVHNSRSSEYDERKKAFRRCECPIFASGTLGGEFRRQNTGQWEWSNAKTIANAWEALGNWNSTNLPEPVVATADPEQPERITVCDATDAFLARCKNRGIAKPTLNKYRTFVKQFRAYCDKQGYRYIDQLTVMDMDSFYASWRDGIRAKAKKLERLKAFVKFCLKREWIAKNITEDLEAPEGSSVPANKTPFTDEELKRIYAACDAVGDPRPPGPGYRPWSGEDVKDFILTAIYTGLRISDLSTFDITKRLHENDIFLRMHKTKKEVYTWVPDWLVARLRERQAKHGPFIFHCGETIVVRNIAERWRDRLNIVFKLAGPFEERPTPHRLRHTFVRVLLQNGVSLADAAELIGDTEAVVRRNYAKWVPERQKRLSRILRDAFESQPDVSRL